MNIIVILIALINSQMRHSNPIGISKQSYQLQHRKQEAQGSFLNVVLDKS